MTFEIKDSGDRTVFDSGMVRDTSAGKVEYDRVLDGPMFERWAEHITNAAEKYPDLPDGRPNWMLANSEAEVRRYIKSLLRHVVQLVRGDRDEDHAAAVMFNVNGLEYTRDRVAARSAAVRGAVLGATDEAIAEVYGLDGVPIMPPECPPPSSNPAT